MGNKTFKKKSVDFDAVRADLKELMSNPDWDDGSYAPGFIRLAWHSSGTYDESDKSGGSSGAGMRFVNGVENKDPENIGLSDYFKLLEPVYKKHKAKGLTISDLWVLAAYVALEVTDGPVVEFSPGRKDATEKEAITPGRLPGAEHGLVPYEEGKDPAEYLDEQGRIKGWENLAQHIRDIFHRMGFTDREIVALVAGGHMYGRCHREYSGYAGAWVENPVKFSNEYAADLLEDDWMYVQHDTKVDGVLIPDETRPIKGKRQYMSEWKPTPAEDLLISEFTPKEHLPGKYKVATGWLNVRRTLQSDSYVIDQPERDAEFNIVVVKQFGKGIRGQLDVGGWVSIISSEGTDRLMERVGDLDLNVGKYRLLNEGKELAYVYDQLPEAPFTTSTEVYKPDGLLECEAVEQKTDENGIVVELYGKMKDGKYVLLVSQKIGALFERVQEGYNESPREAVKKTQVKFQMMLPSDMVLLWDDKFREVLTEYKDDEEKLKEEFGVAYKKLTELGVPVCPAMKS